MKSTLKYSLLVAVIAVVFNAAAIGQVQEDPPEIRIDKRPVRDFGVVAAKMIRSGEIDLKAAFGVEIEATLEKSGKLAASKTRVVKSTGDKKMVAFAKSAVVAMGDSGYFGYLQGLGNASNKILIVVSGSETTFDSSIRMTAGSKERARLNATSLSRLMSMAAQVAKSPSDQLLLRGTSAIAEGSDYIIRMSLPANDMREMIKAKLSTTTSM